jgi:hypothetical protein
VDVAALDARGRPVEDLRVHDFAVKVDGRTKPRFCDRFGFSCAREDGTGHEMARVLRLRVFVAAQLWRRFSRKAASKPDKT